MAQLSWSSQRATLQHFTDLLAQDNADVIAIAQAIRELSEQVEADIRAHAAESIQISQTARQWRAWLAFFADENNTRQYIEAIHAIYAALNWESAGKPYDHFPSNIRLLPCRHLWKIGFEKQQPVLTLPPAMIAFDQAQYRALARMILFKCKRSREAVHEGLMSGEPKTIIKQMEVLAGEEEQTQGAVYKLTDSFNRVNEKYFNNEFPIPKLKWSKRMGLRVFGKCDMTHETITLSARLDDADLPDMLLDYVMYHELLHLVHGLKWSNGTARAHTKAFKTDEEAFEHAEVAEALLKILAGQHPGKLVTRK